MGVPMLISKHALNCSKGSANREKYKNKSHLFLSARWIATKTHDETPQKLQMKHLKNYKWITIKTLNKTHQKLKIRLVINLK